MSDTNTPSGQTPNSAGIVVQSLEERAADAFGGSDPVDEAGSPPPSHDTASSAGSDTPAEDPLAKGRAERKAKLAELNARSRAAVDARAAQREAETLRQQLAAANARASGLVDPTKLDPIKIIELGQRAGHSPAAIADALKSAMGSPELVAAHAARTAVDPVVAQLQTQLQSALERIESFEQTQQSAHQAAQERQALESFASFTQESAPTSPLAARFLAQHGAEEFRNLTMGAAQALPPGAGPQALLDEIEDRLTELGKLYSAAPAAPQRPQANPPRTNTAAAQAPTHVSNTLAQQRSSVVGEDAAFARMSLAERAAFLFDD